LIEFVYPAKRTKDQGPHVGQQNLLFHGAWS